MADQNTSRSAVNELFGSYMQWNPRGKTPFLSRRPPLTANRSKLLWSCAGLLILVLAVIGFTALCVDVAVTGDLFAGSMTGALSFGVGTFMSLCVAEQLHFKVGGDNERLPKAVRWTTRPFKSVYDEATLKVLDGIWTLRETIDELEASRASLDKQRSATDRQRIAEFEQNARAALARGDRESARSLLAAKIDAEAHASWLDEQVAQIDVQLRPLIDREFHLKTLLAVRYMQRESLSAQMRANTARAAIAENALLGELDVPVVLEQASLPKLSSDALEAHARALAGEEILALEQASVQPLDPESVERELAGLTAEIQISRAA